MSPVASAFQFTGRPLEHTLQAALDIAKIGAWGWDVSTSVKLWPPQTKAIFGLDPRIEMTREVFVSLLHPDDVPRNESAWAAAVDPGGGGIYELTYRIRRPNDGAERWISSKALVEFANGRPMRVVGALRDITEEKLATDALRANGRRISDFIEHAPAAIAMFDREMRYLAVSERWLQEYGITDSPIGRSHYEVFPEISDSWKAVHARCLVGATEQSGGEKFIRADGSVHWLKWSARPWFDAQDNIGGLLLSTEEITQRLAVEADLAHFAALVSSSTDAIISKTLDGDIISWNAGATRLFKYEPDEIVGQPISLLIPPERISEERTILARIRAGQRINQYETVRVAKDGRLLDVSLTISPVHDLDGNIVGASKIVRDISDRKRAEVALRRTEVALRQSQSRLRLAADAGRLTFADIDIKRRRLRVSDNFAQVMGCARPSSTGKTAFLKAIPDLLSHVAPEDRARVDAAIDEIFSGKSSGNFECRMIGQDGVQRWIEMKWSVEFGLDREPARAFVTGLDVTDLAESRNALAAAKAEAERANEAKSKFLAAASHDLRQPVQSLVLLTSIIERKLAGQPNSAPLVDMLKASINGLSGLLTSVLEVSRLDAGIIAPAMESVDLSALIQQLAVEFRPKIANKALELRVAPIEVSACTDPRLLERALRNLVENALRYTHSGGILLGLRRRGAFVRIDVIDTGVGIPAGKQSEIFEEFCQLDNAGRDLGKGLGLGLAIVTRLAGLLGARIEVASHVGRGSRFSLLLPLVDAEARRVSVISTEPAIDPVGRILIIEDNASVRFGLERMFQEWGCQTLAANSGEEALHLASQEKFQLDAIVCDDRLESGLTGLATAAEIARRAERAIPTLVLTGETSKERLTEISVSGFSILHKPVAADVLRRMMIQLLAKTS